MITIKQIQNNATVTDGNDTVTLGAGDSYTCSAPEEKLDFIITVDTTIADVSPSDSVNIAFQSGNFLVKWGDGVEEYYNLASATVLTHQYQNGGNYDVEFLGSGFIRNTGALADRKKITSIKQWGKFNYAQLSFSFQNAINITSFPFEDTLSTINSFQNSFQNVPISNFGKIDMSSCTRSDSMFNGSSFNYNIGNWNMARNTFMANMFLGTSMSQANCDAILTGWTRWANGQANITLKSNVSIHMGNTDYTRGGDAEDAFNHLVNTLNWTITFG